MWLSSNPLDESCFVQLGAAGRHQVCGQPHRDARLLQLVELLLGQPEHLTQHLAGVLPQGGGGGARGHGGAGGDPGDRGQSARADLLNAPGVKIVDVSYAPRNADTGTYPLSGASAYPESFVILDDVFVPTERIFLDGEVRLATVFAHSLGLWE